MPLDNWWKRRRRLRVDDVSKQLLGIDPASAQGEDALQAQRFKVGVFIRECIDGGFDPMTMIEMLVTGAAWLGDNYGVTRQQMAKAIVDVEMKRDRQLIFNPNH